LRVIFWKLATFYSYRNLKKLINVNSDISQNLVKIFYVKKYNGEYLKYSPRLGNALTKTALSKYSIWTIEHIHTRLYMNHITPHPPPPPFSAQKICPRGQIWKGLNMIIQTAWTMIKLNWSQVWVILNM